MDCSRRVSLVRGFGARNYGVRREARVDTTGRGVLAVRKTITVVASLLTLTCATGRERLHSPPRDRMPASATVDVALVSGPLGCPGPDSRAPRGLMRVGPPGTWLRLAGQDFGGGIVRGVGPGSDGALCVATCEHGDCVVQRSTKGGGLVEYGGRFRCGGVGEVLVACDATGWASVCEPDAGVPRLSTDVRGIRRDRDLPRGASLRAGGGWREIAVRGDVVLLGSNGGEFGGDVMQVDAATGDAAILRLPGDGVPVMDMRLGPDGAVWIVRGLSHFGSQGVLVRWTSDGATTELRTRRPIILRLPPDPTAQAPRERLPGALLGIEWEAGGCMLVLAQDSVLRRCSPGGRWEQAALPMTQDTVLGLAGGSVLWVPGGACEGDWGAVATWTPTEWSAVASE